MPDPPKRILLPEQLVGKDGWVVVVDSTSPTGYSLVQSSGGSTTLYNTLAGNESKSDGAATPNYVTLFVATKGLQQVTDVNAVTDNELTVQGARIGADGQAGNTYMGIDAVPVSGNNLVLVGQTAGQNSTGNQLTAVGYGAALGNVYDNINAIGYNSTPSASNQTVFGNTSNPIIIDHGIVLDSALLPYQKWTVNGTPYYIALLTSLT